jgi:hypothetical protein
MCCPASDLFRKRLFIAINKHWHSKLFYEAAQALSHSSLPHATVENADEPSTRAVKVWSDPLKAKYRSGERRGRKKGVCARNQISEDSNAFLGISLIFTLDRVAQIWHKLKQELL